MAGQKAILMAGSKVGNLVLHLVAMLGASMAEHWVQLMDMQTADRKVAMKDGLLVAVKESWMAEQTVGSRGKHRAEL